MAKGSTMAFYEFIGILPAKYTEEEIPGVIAELKKVFTKNDAVVKELREVSKAKFAYPIKGSRHGHYIYGEIETAPSALKELNQEFRLSSSLLRHALARVREKDMGRQKQFVFGISHMVAVDRGSAPPRRSVRPTPSIAPPKSSPAEKITMEELDKKLEEILNKEII